MAEFKYNKNNEEYWAERGRKRHVETDYSTAMFAFALDPANIHVSEKDAPDHSYTRHFDPGGSQRYAFPGQAGYSGKGDHPMAVPGVSMDISESSRLGIQAVNTGTPDIERLHRAGDTQSWDTTINQRTYNSPRFMAAIQDQIRTQAAEGSSQWADDHRKLWSSGVESDVSMDDWDDANMTRATQYWKAHKEVMSGKYDHIEDDFEDTVRMRDPRPRMNEKLSSQFKLIPGFVK